MTDINVIMAQRLEKAGILSEALPFLRRHHNSNFVIKYGGHAMGDPKAADTFARAVVLLRHVGIFPVVVHGGGPQIGKMLKRLNIESDFIDGLRVTTQEIVDVVEMVLAGAINKEIVGAITMVGGTAVGISGKDGGLIKAKKLQRTQKDPESNIERILDLGLVGEPSEIDPKILYALKDTAFIPVVSPIGFGEEGETLNINADTSAGAIAGAMEANRLYMLTDVPGVLDSDGNLLTNLSVAEARQLITDGIVTGGMIPKIETCIKAVEDGVHAAVIMDGRNPNVLLVEAFTESGAGTLIHA
ncbi:MAG: acetylglutamate kinase [Alphaproteobacteria bacterium]